MGAPITPAQIRAIHMQTKALGIDGDVYREMLANGYGVTTSKDLTREQAAKFLTLLNDQATRAGLERIVPREGGKRFEELANRPLWFASPAQLRMVEAMWSDVTRADTPEGRSTALDHFIHRITGCSGLLQLERRHVRKVVKALEAMKRQGTLTQPNGDPNESSDSEAAG